MSSPRFESHVLQTLFTPISELDKRACGPKIHHTGTSNAGFLPPQLMDVTAENEARPFAFGRAQNCFAPESLVDMTLRR
jgi:hypothetical protein